MPRPRFASLEPERRAAILATAADELAAHGFEGASYNRIIERAGVSKGAMYYYFDDKEDLLLTALDDAVVRGLAVVGEPAPFDDAHAFWDSLTEFYGRAMDFIAREPSVAGLLKSVFMRPVSSGVSHAVGEYTSRLEKYCTTLAERGVAVGAVRDDLAPALIARIWTSLGDATDRWLLEHWNELPDGYLERYAQEAVALHVRATAPLSLVVERERSPR